MKLHRRLIAFVGLGMLLVIAITTSALQEMASVFMRTTNEVEHGSRQFQRIWDIENKMTETLFATRGFAGTGEERYREAYNNAREAVRDGFRAMSRMTLSQREMNILASVMADFDEMERKSERVIALSTRPGSDRTLVTNLMLELDSLHLWMRKDIAAYKEESAALTEKIMVQLSRDKVKVSLLFIVTLLASLGFLLIFGAYLYRKVSVPLNELWTGTEAISSGNLDHRIPVHEGSDIARLAERFNEMARKLKQSHEDLERKLLARTRQLAAHDAVALTLSRSGSLQEVLHRSLSLVLENLAEIEPKGGIFLCEPDGERLRLFAHRGLSPEFVNREETVKMGECLCGMVAQSGELLYTDQGCDDVRHTRQSDEKGHSHIIVPLKSRGIVLGVMFLYPRKSFALKPSDVQMLDSIGSQLGMAVENLRFYSEVKESSEKYWDLFENSRDILCTLDTEGRFTVVNKAAEEFLGIPKIDLAGKSIFDFLTEEGAGIVRSALAGEAVDRQRMLEFEIRKKDGGRAFVEVIARRLIKNRALAGFQVSARDVTEQKRLREIVLETERLAAICQLGIAVRHEINNPLTTVIGNTELLLEQYDRADDDLKKRLEVVLSNALRIAEIVKRLEGIRKDNVVEYLQGVKMTDLKQE
jgi:PAS domain S-box-containing protein